MKKLLLLLSITAILSCSSDDSSETQQCYTATMELDECGAEKTRFDISESTYNQFQEIIDNGVGNPCNFASGTSTSGQNFSGFLRGVSRFSCN